MARRIRAQQRVACRSVRVKPEGVVPRRHMRSLDTPNRRSALVVMRPCPPARNGCAPRFSVRQSEDAATSLDAMRILNAHVVTRALALRVVPAKRPPPPCPRLGWRCTLSWNVGVDAHQYTPAHATLTIMRVTSQAFKNLRQHRYNGRKAGSRSQPRTSSQCNTLASPPYTVRTSPTSRITPLPTGHVVAEGHG